MPYYLQCLPVQSHRRSRYKTKIEMWTALSTQFSIDLLKLIVPKCMSIEFPRLWLGQQTFYNRFIQRGLILHEHEYYY